MRLLIVDDIDAAVDSGAAVDGISPIQPVVRVKWLLICQDGPRRGGQASHGRHQAYSG